MIALVNQFAANIEEKKGSVTEDEVYIVGLIGGGKGGAIWGCSPT